MSCVYIYLSCHMKSQEICMRNASVFARYVFVQRIGHIITALAKPCVLLSSCVFKDAQTVKSFWAHGLWRPECQANSAAIISSSFCLFSSLFLDEKVDFKVKEGFFYHYSTLHLRFCWSSCCVVFAFWAFTPRLFSHLPCSSHTRLTLHKMQWPFRCRWTNELSSLAKMSTSWVFFPSLLVVCFCERPWQVAVTLKPLASGYTCALCFWTALWPLLQTKKPFHTLI